MYQCQSVVNIMVTVIVLSPFSRVQNALNFTFRGTKSKIIYGAPEPTPTGEEDTSSPPSPQSRLSTPPFGLRHSIPPQF